jgi:hypothetical protein
MTDKSNDEDTIAAARQAIKDFLATYEIHSPADILDAVAGIDDMLSNIWYIQDDSIRAAIVTWAINDRWGGLL